ncbi:S8 family serine peptidase [Paenibacillus abyssi]|uniref:SLH domain-containing protein n=1 Tax=Paenibacillus abyssi TaxID=1340531 RepID=A0A917FT37_9BACL|nr:S8 family serine peptidase [Paenibacillus abyssi]GGF99292.1 hypothetical protein GCM10010916_15720 [Paenibacillus abyssi]
MYKTNGLYDIKVLMVISLLLFVFFPVSTSYGEGSSDGNSADGQLVRTEEALPGQILIKYKQRPDNRNFGARSVTNISGTSYKKLDYSPNMDVIEKIEQLESDPAVAYAEPVYRVYTSTVVTESVYFNPSDPVYMKTWGQQVTGLAQAREFTTPEQNKRVKVAVLDTGVDLDHPDLAGHLLPGKNFVTSEIARNPSAPPQDYNGHGTHVAGIIAANAQHPDGYAGIAPGTSIVPVKILNNNGIGDTAGLLSGIEYAMQQQVDFINLSLGFYSSSNAVHDAVKRAAAQGILIFSASGNDSNHWIGSEPGQLFQSSNDTGRYFGLTNYPAAYPEVVSVGALAQLADHSLTIADFSNIGKVDIAAPGVNIYSTYLEEPNVIGDGYAVMHGTSQAAPFAAGFAALLKSRNPALTAGEIRQILQDTAREISLTRLNYNDNSYRLEPSTMAEYFGSGLIRSEGAYTFPRLQMDLDTSLFASERKVKADVRIVDSYGAIIGQDAGAALQAWSVKEDEPLGAITRTLISESDIPLQAGDGAATLTLPDQDVYHFVIYSANRLDGDRMIRSKFYELIRRPRTPVANLVSGVYNGKQTVSLSDNTQGAKVYYMFSAAVGGNVTSGVYNGSIPITESGVLTVFSLKNHVFSEKAYYHYIINPESASAMPDSSAGGEVIVPVPAPAPTPPAPAPIPAPTPTPTPVPAPTPAAPEKEIVSGERGKVVHVRPEQNELVKLIEDNTINVVTIDARANDDIDQVYVILPIKALQLAAAGKKTVNIEADDFTLSFPPGAIEKAAVDADVTFIAQKKTESDIRPAKTFEGERRSPLYDFNLSADGKKITRFNTPVKISFLIDNTGYDPDKLGIFLFEETKNSWVYAGGKITGGLIEANVKHFSTYGVFELDKTFDDIKGHWARKEIETLASKQIITGVNASQFIPGVQVNRAQFASLLARTLLLDEQAEGIHFHDVPANAWYAQEVMRAFEAGIINGVSSTRFEPDKALTREQMAAMLVKAYLSAAGKQLSEIGENERMSYKDEMEISPWAREYVRAAAVLGLLHGMPDQRFEPKGITSRAQAARAVYQLFSIIPS